MDNVRFIKCTQAEYDKQTSVDNNALYFIEDTNRLYQGKKTFQGYKSLDLSQYTDENPFNAIKEGVANGSYIVIKSGIIDIGNNAEIGNCKVLEGSVLTVTNSYYVIFTDINMLKYNIKYNASGRFQNFVITELGSLDTSNNHVTTVMPLTDMISDNNLPLLTYIEPGLLFNSPVYYDSLNMNLLLKISDKDYIKCLTEQDIGDKVSAPLTWETI